ncbi:MAG: hypothetical protein IPN70_02950 [Candidatus Moraniibacteriota bacterium]|nr:MAG: hypothetical protein IPN70_02950 [Candidatus Moranbacteria bacterium]
MARQWRYCNCEPINSYGGVTMRTFFSRYTIGLLVGTILGLAYPASASVWSFFILLGVLVVNELMGRWGFGQHWNGYRLSSYALHFGFLACIWLGIQFGSGNIGTFLVFVGEKIS